MSAAESGVPLDACVIEAFNGLADVVDFLTVLDMALASEDGADPFPALGAVNAAALTRAKAAHEAAKRACALCSAAGST